MMSRSTLAMVAAGALLCACSDANDATVETENEIEPIDGFGEDGIGTGDAANAPACTEIANEARPSDRADRLEGVTVATLAGGAAPGSNDGTGAEASFANPVNVVFDPAGDLTVADFDNDRLRVVTSAGKTFTVGTGAATFRRPFGLAWLGDRLYAQTDRNASGEIAADAGSLWLVDFAAGEVEVLIENVGRPRGLAPRGQSLAMADARHQVVRLFQPADSEVRDWVGKWDCPGFADGMGSEARFDSPAGIAVDPDGNIIVADRGNHAIRRITPEGRVTTIAGKGTPGYVDGHHAEAYFDRPTDVAVDEVGRVYVSDLGNRRIRRIDSSGVQTVAGGGSPGHADGPGAEALFHGQEGLAVSPDGHTIYVADGTLGDADAPHHRLRVVTLE